MHKRKRHLKMLSEKSRSFLFTHQCANRIRTKRSPFARRLSISLNLNLYFDFTEVRLFDHKSVLVQEMAWCRTCAYICHQSSQPIDNVHYRPCFVLLKVSVHPTMRWYWWWLACAIGIHVRLMRWTSTANIYVDGSPAAAKSHSQSKQKATITVDCVNMARVAFVPHSTTVRRRHVSLHI